MADLSALALACAGGYLGVLGFKLLGVWCTLRARRNVSAPPPTSGGMCDVALLQPILGGDPLLAQVLGDNLRALPDAQFVWLLDEDDSVGCAVARQLVAQHPGHRIRCRLHAPAPDGVNPKTFKLAAALPEVVEGTVVVLDDDARLSRPALTRMLAELRDADLVTALPCYRDDGAAGARLMAQFVNNNAALTYLSLLPWLSPRSINGMCYAMRTARLRTLGGFAPIARQLADDLALAHTLRAQGAVLFQSTASVEVQTHTPSLAQHVRQMHRWFLFATLLLQGESRTLQAVVAVLHGLPPLLLAGLLVMAVAQPVGPAGIALCAVVLLRATVLVALQRRLTGRARHRPVASLLAELMQPVHLLHACLVRRIRWRTRRYDVRANDDFHHAP